MIRNSFPVKATKRCLNGKWRIPSKRFRLDGIMQLDGILLDELVKLLLVHRHHAVNNFAHVAYWFDRGDTVLSISSVARAPFVMQP